MYDISILAKICNGDVKCEIQMSIDGNGRKFLITKGLHKFVLSYFLHKMKINFDSFIGKIIALKHVTGHVMQCT